MDKCPSHFYRYRSLSGSSAEYVEQTICHSELYFPKPSSFNDPFDCRPSFLFEASNKEMTAYYERVIKKYMPHLTPAQVRQEAKEKLGDWERSPRNPETINRIREMHTANITEKIGVLCLSEVKNDILMWSHYADSHRGICLEFDGHFPFFAHTQEVKYPFERPRINPFRQGAVEMMEAALLTKAAHWAYEHEWRLVQYSNGPGVYHFPPEALTGVILGVLISQKDIERIVGWVKARAHPIQLYRSSQSDTTFSLNIEEVKIDNL